MNLFAVSSNCVQSTSSYGNIAHSYSRENECELSNPIRTNNIIIIPTSAEENKSDNEQKTRSELSPFYYLIVQSVRKLNNI